jgi:hypothetical protein
MATDKKATPTALELAKEYGDLRYEEEMAQHNRRLKEARKRVKRKEKQKKEEEHDDKTGDHTANEDLDCECHHHSRDQFLVRVGIIVFVLFVLLVQAVKWLCRL